MELSARDKRILAEIECESALEDPRWVRAFERLGRPAAAPRSRWLRRVGLVAATLAWTALLVLGAVLGVRQLLWAALGVAVLGFTILMVVRRRVHGYWYWYRPRRRISRIPRQSGGGRTARDRGEDVDKG